MKTRSEKYHKIRALLIDEQQDALILKNIDQLSFVISLLPIPGLQQVAQIANRILGEPKIIKMNRYLSAAMLNKVGLAELELEEHLKWNGKDERTEGIENIIRIRNKN